MTAVFERILEMSLTSAVVIVVVMAIRLLLRKAPRKYSYALWSVAAFRLVCPVSFRAFFSLFRFVRTVEGTKVEQTVLSPVPTVSPGYFDSVPPGAFDSVPPVEFDPDYMFTYPISTPPEANAPMTEVPAAASIDWVQVAAIVWLIGLAVLVIYGIVSYVRLRRRMDTAVLEGENVWNSDRVQSPFILGFLRPRIYMPFGLSEDQQRYVLAHERYHIKRLDHIVRPLAFLILVVHWFNPLVWVAYYMMSRDMEMSCDEKVLSEEDNIRKEYSITLLSFAANRRFPSPSPLAFGESGVKGRIKNALNWKKPRTWVTIIAIIVCIVVIIVCAANPASHPHDWTKDLTLEDVDWAELMVNGEERSYRRLSGEELQELVGLLNGLRRSEMKQPRPLGTWAFPTERRVTICCDGIEYELNLGPSPMTLNSDDEAVAWVTDDPWFVGSEELKQFIRELAVTETELVAEPDPAYYQSVECLFLSSLSSVIGTADSGYYYLVWGDNLHLIDKQGNTYHSHTAAGEWQELSEEFLHKMEEGTLVLGESHLWDTLRNEKPMIRLYGDDKLLLNFGDELWVGTYHYDRSGDISLWDLYRLEFTYPGSTHVIPIEILDIPAEHKLLLSALYDEVEVIDTGLGMTDVLSKLVAATSPDVEMEITNLAAVDLDGDGVRELLLLIETPGTVYGTKILRYNAGDGQIYAYDLWYRAFKDVKTDGTFAYSGGAADNGFGRISFTADGYEVEKITYSESLYPGHEVNCYVNGEPATEQEFIDAFALWQETPGVTWAEYDPVNALRLLTQVEAQEMPPASYYLSADLTHDGVDEIITIRQETDEVPIIHSVIVSYSNGEELWRGEVSDMRGGHNGFYLYERDGKHYIMQWVPDTQQDWNNFNYKVFSFSQSGEINVLAGNAVQYDFGAYENGTDFLTVDLEELRAFEAEVNALLKDATPLLVIHNDKTLIGEFSVTDQWTSPADEWEWYRQLRLEQQADREARTLAVWPLNDLTLTVLETKEDGFYSMDVYGAGDYFFWEQTLDRWEGDRLYFRYTENGVQYLMELYPGGSQGVGMWSYRIFSVRPESTPVLRENSLYFQSTNVAEALALDVSAIRAFVDEVNALLENAELIAGFENREFLCADPGAHAVYRWNPTIADTLEENQAYWRGMEQKLNEAVREQVDRYYEETLRQSGGTGHGQFIMLDKYMDKRGAAAWVVASFIEVDKDGYFMAEYENIPMTFTFDMVDEEYVLLESWVEEKGMDGNWEGDIAERFPRQAARAVVGGTYMFELRTSICDNLAWPIGIILSGDKIAFAQVLDFANSYIVKTHPDARYAQVYALEEISTAAVGTTSGHILYRLEYCTAKTSGGQWSEQEQVYLVIHRDWSSSSNYWYSCGTLTQQEIDTTYSTEAMLEKYNGDPYLAAVVETVNQWSSNR